jgi:hypothetical protein
VAGAAVAVSAQEDGSYRFTMPGRNVRVEAVLENDTTGGQPYQLAAPDGLDAIWELWIESSGSGEAGGEAGGEYAAGSTVFVHVRKNPDALSTTLLGITVTVAGTDVPVGTGASTGTGQSENTDIPVAVLKEGLFAFTMPADDAAITLDVSHALLAVAAQSGVAGTPQTVGTYDRAAMEALAQTTVYYSGWSSETDPMIGRADTSVALSALLADAGLTFAAGDVLRVGSIDGMFLSYSYEELMGVPRYYYPALFDESAAGRTAFEPILTIKQNVVLRSAQAGSEPPAGDELNAYRFILGQSEDEFTNHTKVVDRLLKYVVSITVIKASPPPPGAPGSGDIDGDGAVTAADLIKLARAAFYGVAADGFTEAQLAAVDMDGNGALAANDLILLARRMMSL